MPCQHVRDAQRIFYDQALELMIIDPLFMDDSGFEFHALHAA